MLIKIICGIIIVLGFSYVGRMYAEREKSRLSQLDAFCDGLNMLEFNIRYMNFPMLEAFRRAAECCLQPVKAVFETSAGYLGCGEGISSGDAFCRGIEENRKAITLSETEIDILKSFSVALGKGDKSAEITNIEAAKIRLSASCQEARSEVNKKAKLINGVSTLSGVFTVIVLF